ncbi:MAG: GIY-YIG nuclease family protein [Bacteroidales bacterium]|nr:GIY-YIG nuclease family protein [Bacteroidales bacterium]
MPYVYILYSESLDRYYVGSTHGTVEERLYKHNNRHKGFTSTVADWQPVYSEYFKEYPSALLREKEIKKWKNRKMIERLIQPS